MATGSDTDGSGATTPVISVEEYHDNPCFEHCCPSNEDAPMFLRVPDYSDVVKTPDPEQRRFSTGSQRLDRSARKRVIQRRDTPPSSDPIFKLHLSPRGQRKIIRPLKLDALSETESTSSQEVVQRVNLVSEESQSITQEFSKMSLEQCQPSKRTPVIKTEGEGAVRTALTAAPS
ncbi:hypothetical protein CAPTEDRAFT_197023 [Capitella teleta]|uniref:Uncharacterized protein n=1 Tax=Capitella teleta TaxID=283909 RepID=R7V626_CAPTE|nr:hypothetical protein CAPTEDRAFT_197023 [Capitella teleta]|eukprot:ELU14034.1 hypothetical protein CAPTEDRAFT_197023 [Capitella teleta]